MIGNRSNWMPTKMSHFVDSVDWRQTCCINWPRIIPFKICRNIFFAWIKVFFNWKLCKRGYVNTLSAVSTTDICPCYHFDDLTISELCKMCEHIYCCHRTRCAWIVLFSCLLINRMAKNEMTETGQEIFHNTKKEKKSKKRQLKGTWNAMNIMAETITKWMNNFHLLSDATEEHQQPIERSTETIKNVPENQTEQKIAEEVKNPNRKYSTHRFLYLWHSIFENSLK